MLFKKLNLLLLLANLFAISTVVAVVKETASEADLNDEIKNNKLVVVDFYATWCGPCKEIAPFLDELSNKHTNVTFIKVNVDKNKGLCERIESFPTFEFYENGRKTTTFPGASKDFLKQKLQEMDPVATTEEEKPVKPVKVKKEKQPKAKEIMSKENMSEGMDDMNMPMEKSMTKMKKAKVKKEKMVKQGCSSCGGCK